MRKPTSKRINTIIIGNKLFLIKTYEGFLYICQEVIIYNDLNIAVSIPVVNNDFISMKEFETGNSKNTTNKTGLKARYTYDDYIGKSELVVSMMKKARNYSKTDANILIVGESGTGKEVLANGIHNESPRKDGPFVAVNCAALPQSLLESELFGYEEGPLRVPKRMAKLESLNWLRY